MMPMGRPSPHHRLSAIASHVAADDPDDVAVLVEAVVDVVEVRDEAARAVSCSPLLSLAQP
jgi:hypothetical protein